LNSCFSFFLRLIYLTVVFEKQGSLCIFFILVLRFFFKLREIFILFPTSHVFLAFHCLPSNWNFSIFFRCGFYFLSRKYWLLLISFYHNSLFLWILVVLRNVLIILSFICLRVNARFFIFLSSYLTQLIILNESRFYLNQKSHLLNYCFYGFQVKPSEIIFFSRRESLNQPLLLKVSCLY
jgi:hypothetical protein